MDISKGLILKGTAATTAVATTSTGAYYHEEIIDYFTDDSSDVEDVAGSSGPGAGEGQSSGEGGAGNSVQAPRLPAVDNETTKWNSLGLEGCTRPTSVGSPTTCSNLDSNKLKKINFDGKGDEDLTVSGSEKATLEIKKLNDGSNYSEKYLFIFKTESASGITITGRTGVSVTLKKGMDLEFKIKEADNKWSLERVWNKTTLAEKVNLTCSGDSSGSNECTFKGTGTINILDDTNSKAIGATITLDKGKIKFEENQEGYNQGLKLTVAEDDIEVSGGSNGGGITKLKKYSTYEIKEIDESGKKWFLSRKTSAKQEINKKLLALGLPANCKFEDGKNDDPKDCGDLDGNALKKIKFEGLGDSFTASINGGQKVKLKISKNSNNDKKVFPDGIKIVFENAKKVTLTNSASTSSIEWKKGTNPEFKINSSGKLERAWTVDKLAEKVGLTCSASDSAKECSFKPDKKISVHEGGTAGKKSTKLTVKDANDKKMIFSENEENHNQGFKFVVKDANIALTLDSGDNSGINALTKSNTSYEIKYIDDGWYLHKITPTAS